MEADTWAAGDDRDTPAGPTERERQVVSFARGGGLNLVGAICNQAALLGVTLLVARRLGRVDVGVYAQAYAFLALLGLLSMLGLTTGLTRFVAVHLAARDAGAVRGTVRLGLVISTAVAGAIGATLFAAAPLLARGAFHEPRLALPLQFVAMALPASAFTNAALAATLGYRTMKPFALIGLVFEPVARLVLTAVLLLLGMELQGVMFALLASNVGAAVLAALALRRVMGPATAPATYQFRQLLAFSAVSWFAGLASTALVWADILLLGLLGNSGQVGVYNVATRLVNLATFVMVPINAAFAPRIADLDHRGETESLRHTYGLAASWIIRLSLPAFVLLMVFPRQLLAVFGSGFAIGAAVTMILAVGKFVDAATGPCGLMLNMSGRPSINVLDNVVGLLVNIGLNLLLIPRYGIVGSAVAWAVSLCLVNGARVVQVWQAMRMLPFEPAAAKGLVAAAAATVAALAVRAAPLSRPATLVVGGAVVMVVYLGGLLLQGLTAEDRLVLSALLRRRRIPDWVGSDPAAAGAVPDGVGPMVAARFEALALPASERSHRARPRYVPERPPRPPRARPPVSPARSLRTLWRWRLVVAAGLLAGVVLGTTVLPVLLPSRSTYRATVRLELRPFAVERVVGPAPGPSGAELAGQALNVEVASELTRGRVAGQLDAVRGLAPEQRPTGLLAAIRAEPVARTRWTVALSLVDGSARRARLVLESYARRLTGKRNAADRSRTAEALTVLDQQARDLHLDLVRWGQRVDQERAAALDGRASTPTQTQFDAFRDRYRAKLAEQERLREQAALGGRPTVVRLPATSAPAKTPLGRERTLAVGVLTGLLAGVLLALLLEGVRPRVVTEDDTAAAAGVDVLVAVPRRRRWRRRPGMRSAAEAEAYRRLAFSLERRGLGEKLSVVAVASAELGEGKSAVAVGLATALSRRGWAVVVVSGDLRRPVVERILGVPEVPGLGEYLESSGDDVVPMLVPARDNLLLLPAGWTGRSPAHLLARPHLAQAVEQLRNLEVIALVDTPAARWWSDALALAAEADATLLVARSGRSRWKSLAGVSATLQRDQFPLLGAVLVGAGRQTRRVRRAARAGRAEGAASSRPSPARPGLVGNGNGHHTPGRGGDPARQPDADPPR
jgi:O-antigen/teichoic acid export membrane protein/Mrp family chromosome partitioning ATPase